MTVGQLKAQLKDVPDNMLVVLAKDEEGNGFSSAHNFTLGVFEADNPSGEGLGDFDNVLSDDLDDGNEGEHNAICFWPH